MNKTKTLRATKNQEMNIMKTSAKTKLIIILASVMACMMVATFTACDGADGKSEATEGLEYYLLPDDTFGVKAGTTLYLDKVVVPAMYKGKAVTQILNSAFQSATNLKEILLPDTIKKIQDVAFNNCPALEKITIPNSVTSIGNNAFYYSGLTSVIIPDSVTTIGNNAFAYCNELTSVTIGNGITSIGDYTFIGCGNLMSVTIGSGVTSIGNSAFTSCRKLIEVINNSNLNITKESFDNGQVGYYALSIKKGGTTDIVNKGGYLFYTYENVNYLLGSVGKNTELILPNDYNGMSYEIYEGAFTFRSELTSVTIPNVVTSIGNIAFWVCRELTSITIPSSVTSIGYQAFDECGKLKTVYYVGNKEQWSNISIEHSNYSLTSATRYYYSKTEPALTADGTAYDGNYWHYAEDGITPVIWKKD